MVHTAGLVSREAWAFTANVQNPWDLMWPESMGDTYRDMRPKTRASSRGVKCSSFFIPAVVISCHCSLSSLYFSTLFYTPDFLFPYCVPPILLDVPALSPTISSMVAVMPIPSSRLSNVAQMCQNLHCYSLFPFRMKCSPFSSIPLACAFKIWHLSPVSISPISCYL